MKIALIHPSASPVSGDVERLIQLQIRILQQGGHCVSLACFEGGQNGPADCFIPLSREASRHALTLYLEAALAGSDAVIFHDVGTVPTAPELTAALRALPRRLPSARWICWVHQVACMDAAFLPFGSQEIAYWMSTPCADWEYVAANSRSAELLRQAYGVPCFLIPSGIDCAGVLDLPPALGQWAVDSRVWEAEWILHLPVPIQPHRGIETSISVLEQLRARFRNAFLLVGTRQGETGGPASPYAESLRQLRNSAGLEKTCVFAGEHFPASREMLRGWQRLADAVFLPAPVPDPEAVFGEAALWGMPVFHPEAAAHTPYGNGIAYPTAASPAEIAEWLIRQTGMRDPIQARRLARAQQSWPESYQKSLASFLEKLHN